MVVIANRGGRTQPIRSLNFGLNGNQHYISIIAEETDIIELMTRWIVILLMSGGYATAAAQADTASLATALKAVRGRDWIHAAEYKKLQAQYFSWIDARLKAGKSLDEMNAELREAHLLFEPNDTLRDISRSFAGYLIELSEQSKHSAPGIRVIDARIHRGVSCSVASTALVYQTKPAKQLGQLEVRYNNPDEGWAYHLEGISVGPQDSNGARLVASGWTISNCTSTRNDKAIRIDRLKPGGVEKLFERSIWARSGWSEEGDFLPAIKGSDISFRYPGATGDGMYISLPTEAHYSVEGNRVILQSPIALTRAGFIHEWLTMSNADAARWSATAALTSRQALASEFKQQGIEFGTVAQCGVAPLVWEVEVKFGDSKQPVVFRIGGAEPAS